jgi:hypothetical protein
MRRSLGDPKYASPPAVSSSLERSSDSDTVTMSAGLVSSVAPEPMRNPLRRKDHNMIDLYTAATPNGWKISIILIAYQNKSFEASIRGAHARKGSFWTRVRS